MERADRRVVVDADIAAGKNGEFLDWRIRCRIGDSRDREPVGRLRVGPDHRHERSRAPRCRAISAPLERERCLLVGAVGIGKAQGASRQPGVADDAETTLYPYEVAGRIYERSARLQPVLEEARRFRVGDTIAQDDGAVRGVDVLGHEPDILAEFADAVVATIRTIDIAIDEISAALAVSHPAYPADRDEPARARVVRRPLLMGNAGVAQEGRACIEGLQRLRPIHRFAGYRDRAPTIGYGRLVADHEAVGFLDPGILVARIAMFEARRWGFRVHFVVFDPHAHEASWRRVAIFFRIVDIGFVRNIAEQKLGNALRQRDGQRARESVDCHAGDEGNVLPFRRAGRRRFDKVQPGRYAPAVRAQFMARELRVAVLDHGIHIVGAERLALIETRSLILRCHRHLLA